MLLLALYMGIRVADLAFTVVTVAFFAVAVLYIRGCERLR
jgi:hypothetical protein